MRGENQMSVAAAHRTWCIKRNGMSLAYDAMSTAKLLPIGTRDIISTPHAITMSMSPDAIACDANCTTRSPFHRRIGAAKQCREPNNATQLHVHEKMMNQ